MSTAMATQDVVDEFEPRKMCSRNHAGSERTTIWLTPKALEELGWLLEFYFLVLGRKVSISLVIRRGLELLKGQIKDTIRKGDRAGVFSEAQKLEELR